MLRDPKDGSVKNKHLKILMILIFVLTCLSYIYIFALHVYGPNLLHACCVGIICFYMYKGNKFAKVCYYVFSCGIILMGGLAVVTWIVKYSRGILLRIRNEVLLIYALRAVIHFISLILVREWTK